MYTNATSKRSLWSQCTVSTLDKLYLRTCSQQATSICTNPLPVLDGCLPSIHLTTEEKSTILASLISDRSNTSSGNHLLTSALAATVEVTSSWRSTTWVETVSPSYWVPNILATGPNAWDDACRHIQVVLPAG